MDFLWSPWRYQYIRESAEGEPRPEGCVFCRAGDAPDRRGVLVLGRAAHSFVILNLYPYTSGHLMVVPFRHVASLADLDAGESSEMMELAKRAERALREVYRPDG